MWKNVIAIILSGICIGFLLGLSRSEVLGSVLVPIVTVVMSFISILAGLKFSSKENEEQDLKIKITSINAFPIMWLFVSLTLGTIPGMFVRNYNLLSPKVEKQKIEGNTEKDIKIETQNENLTGLFSFNSKACQDYNLCNLKGFNLICQLIEIEAPTIEKMLAIDNINIQEIENQIKKSCKCN